MPLGKNADHDELFCGLYHQQRNAEAKAEAALGHNRDKLNRLGTMRTDTCFESMLCLPFLSNRNPKSNQRLFNLRNRVIPRVNHARNNRCIRMRLIEHICKVLRAAGPA